jgi:arabinofuranan 3-O-arabinosyltransferase
MWSTDVAPTGQLIDTTETETGTVDRSAWCADPLSRWVLVGVAALFLVAAFSQAWGKIETDTELPLVLSPTSFINAALHVWNPVTFGGFANPQSVGLIFPMGLFFSAAHLIHLPIWVTERIWLALLLTVGCWGVARLCEALGIGSRFSRILAGLAYCITPIVVTSVSSSASLLAVVLLPWVVIPLVWGSQGGSPRRAAALSGVALALMGGVNATVVFAVLPVAAIWLLTRQPGPRRRALMGWWIVAVVAACFWWLAPLVLTSGLTYNYLPFSETPAVTTSTASAFEALRGASYWLDYYDFGSPIVPGAWTIVSSAVVIVGTTAMTAIGLAGLCRRIPERFFLVCSMCFGVLVIAIGYVGAAAGPLGHTVQQGLGGALGPLRNVGKFSPAVALPLCIGLAFLVSDRIRSSTGARQTSRLNRRRVTTVLVGSAVVAALIIAATPFWRLELYRPGGFASIPNYWTQAGSWLDDHQGHGVALLVPGASFADYTWGNPNDEPLQVTANTDVEWRNLIPLGSNGNTQVLETVEQVLDSGVSPPGFAQFLSREGVDYVVARNDLNLGATGAPPPAQVHEVLSETTGLREVASFGPLLSPQQSSGHELPVFGSVSNNRLRPVEVFQVLHPTSGLHTYPAADPLVVSGDAGSLLPMATANVLANRAAILAGDPLAQGVSSRPLATWVITDGNQRRDQLLGTIRDNLSYVLGPGQSVSNAALGAPLGFVVVPGEVHETVEAPIGAASVSASSYGSYSFASVPDEGPAAAFDRNPFTAWVANSQNDSVGQWISITFQHPRKLSTITIDALAGIADVPTVRKVTITTDRGSVKRNLAPSSAPQVMTVPSGLSSKLTIRIDKVTPASKVSLFGNLGAGIKEIDIPGVTFHPRLQTPSDENSSFSASGRQTPEVVLTSTQTDPNIDLGQSANLDPDMARLVTLPKAMQAQVSGTVTPQPGPALEGIIEQVAPSPGPIVVSASSWLGNLPQFRPQNLVERSPTPWIAGLGDPDPSVGLAWASPVVVSSLELTLSPEASPPTEISISDGNQTRIADVPKGGGLITFPGLMTNRLSIRFVHVDTSAAVVPPAGGSADLPVGLAALRVPAVTSTLAATQAPSTQLLLPCGSGPTVVIDGSSLSTAVGGTLADLVDLRPMTFAPCTPGGTIALTAGRHTLLATNAASAFRGTSLVLQGPPVSRTPERAARKATLTHWAVDTRVISVSAGPATYVAVAQNYSAGWKANFDGHPLRPIRLDGWQQGYLIPAGTAGTVTLSMASDESFRALLLVGALLLGGLLVLALIPGSGVSPPVAGARPLPRRGVLMIGSSMILLLVAGWWALVAVPLFVVARRWGPNAMAAIAFFAFMAAGIFVALHPGSQPALHTGAFGSPAQVATETALAAVLCALMVPQRRERRRGEHAAPRTR